MNAFKLSLLLLLCLGLLSPVNSYYFSEAPPGDWMVVNGVLTNGTYNTTDLTKRWDYHREVSVVASDIVFVYNDGISKKYKGDAGLEYAMFNDTLTGSCYHMDKNLTRGIAYATNKKFNIKNFSFECTRFYGNAYNPPVDFYEVYGRFAPANITLDNGTVIKSLCINQDLTPDQKLYFDDYETQLYKYYEDKRIKEMEDTQHYLAELDDDMMRMSSNSKQSGHYYGYSSSGGYMYGHYY